MHYTAMLAYRGLGDVGQARRASRNSSSASKPRNRRSRSRPSAVSSVLKTTTKGRAFTTMRASRWVRHRSSRETPPTKSVYVKPAGKSQAKRRGELSEIGLGTYRRRSSAPPRCCCRDNASAIQVAFTDVTAQAGIKFVHNAGKTGKKYLPETLGSGAAFFDADGDGWIDILLVNGKDWTPKGRQHNRRTLSQQSQRHVHRYHARQRPGCRDLRHWSRRGRL